MRAVISIFILIFSSNWSLCQSYINWSNESKSVNPELVYLSENILISVDHLFQDEDHSVCLTRITDGVLIDQVLINYAFPISQKYSDGVIKILEYREGNHFLHSFDLELQEIALLDLNLPEGSYVYDVLINESVDVILYRNGVEVFLKVLVEDNSSSQILSMGDIWTSYPSNQIGVNDLGEGNFLVAMDCMNFLYVNSSEPELSGWIDMQSTYSCADPGFMVPDQESGFFRELFTQELFEGSNGNSGVILMTRDVEDQEVTNIIQFQDDVDLYCQDVELLDADLALFPVFTGESALGYYLVDNDSQIAFEYFWPETGYMYSNVRVVRYSNDLYFYGMRWTAEDELKEAFLVKRGVDELTVSIPSIETLPLDLEVFIHDGIIQWNGDSNEQSTIYIYDVSGRLVWSGPVIGNSFKLQRAINYGMYLVRVEQNYKVGSSKVIYDSDR